MHNSEYHVPVMCAETGNYLVNNPSGTYVDCTLGGGGHSLYLLQKYPAIKIIGLDCDQSAIDEASNKLSEFSSRTKFVKENFSKINEIIQKNGLGLVDGVLADLGVSSWQLNNSEKGFSFRSDKLDMRMDTSVDKNAQDLVNSYSQDELKTIFFQFGEERFAEKISRKIVEERKKERIESGKQLAEIVEKVKKRVSGVHPATKVFQALRIAVNNELSNLTLFLDQLPSVLAPGGRAVVISYHSLEDRIVKNQFRDKAKEGAYKVLTKKVVMPSDEEVKQNSRSRSAKLRSAEKL